MDGLEIRLPLLELLLGVAQNLPCFVTVGEWLADVAWNDRSVVEQVEESAAVFSKDDLLLSSLNCGSEMQVICLLDLLTSLQRSGIFRHR